MKQYDYLVIGGGMTADAAVRGIREVDSKGSIGMLTAENVPPYARPPLSKSLLIGDKELNEIWCGTEELGVDILTGRTALSVDPAEKIVRDQDETYHYGKLLFATGGAPVQLPFSGERIIYYRDLSDYKTLDEQIRHYERFAVVGGGFIGCELAAALAMRGKQVAMVFPEQAPGAGRFPDPVARDLADLYAQRKVDLYAHLKLSQVTRSDNDAYRLQLEDGQMLEVDGIVAGLGISPRTRLAEAAGLHVDDGILVDGNLRTNEKDIYAAGDVARFPVAGLGKHMRFEHEDNAVSMGRQAGRNMAGKKESYDHLPYFYSDMFDVGYEALGELNARFDTVGSWSGLHEKGVWAYVSEGRVRGVLLWNLFGQTDAARALIQSKDTMERGAIGRQLQEIVQAA